MRNAAVYDLQNNIRFFESPRIVEGRPLRYVFNET